MVWTDARIPHAASKSNEANLNFPKHKIETLAIQTLNQQAEEELNHRG